MAQSVGRRTRVAGVPPIKSAQSKTAVPARPKTSAKRVAKKVARGRTQPTRAPSSRTTAPELDAVLAAKLESMAQELGEIREIRADLRVLRRLVEALTDMIEALPANRQDSNPKRKATSEEDQPPVEDATEPGTVGDHDVLETAESTPSAW